MLCHIHSIEMSEVTASAAHDYLFKFVIIGDAGCGKSCLLHHFVEGKFRKNSSYTIGVEFGSKTVQVAGKALKLQIWDTAGQERYRAVTRSYYRGAVGAVVVYDVTSKDSFDHSAAWVTEERTMARPDTAIVLVGNKADLKDKREVTFLAASKFAQEHDILFVETSALTGDGVDDVFMKLAKGVLNKVDDGSLDSGVVNSSGSSLSAVSTKASFSSEFASNGSSSCAC